MLSSKKNRYSKQRTKISGLFNWGYIINNKNETENKKSITDTTEMDLGLLGCTFEMRQGGLEGFHTFYKCLWAQKNRRQNFDYKKKKKN